MKRVSIRDDRTLSVNQRSYSLSAGRPAGWGGGAI